MAIDMGVPARKRSLGLAHDLVAEFTQQIDEGRIRPGDRLPSETTIVRERGVSRTVVREALSKLQAAGLVETRHGIGTFAIERQQDQGLHLDVDTAMSVRGILELRLGLETQAAALAALRRTEEQLLQMRRALDDYQRSLSHNKCSVDHDRRFHLLIAEATGNPYFSEIIRHLGSSMIPRTAANALEGGAGGLSAPGYLVSVEHEAILNAIRKRDPDAARAAMWLHLTNSRDRFSAA